MWIEYLENNRILYNVYNKIPELLNVRMEEFSLMENGNKVKMVIDMPCFADHPPQKWEECNTISIELDFWIISDFQWKSHRLTSDYICNISIKKEEILAISMSGSICCEFKAELGMIQKVYAYT